MSHSTLAILQIVFQILQFISPQVREILIDAVKRLKVAAENTESKWDDVLAVILGYLLEHDVLSGK